MVVYQLYKRVEFDSHTVMLENSTIMAASPAACARAIQQKEGVVSAPEDQVRIFDASPVVRVAAQVEWPALCLDVKTAPVAFYFRAIDVVE